MRTTIYIDGFNLYYGSLRDTPYKWLNIVEMCRLLLPNHEVHRVKYFTARVGARPTDPDQPTRQAIYLRALQTLPEVETILGHFLVSEVFMPIAESVPLRYVKVIKTEEKGSDVNIATHLLHDGHRGDYELAVLVTNDSDLLEAVRIVRNDLGLPVGILNPHKHPSKVLRQQATFLKQIRKGVLAASQFPPTLRDDQGVITKPARW